MKKVVLVFIQVLFINSYAQTIDNVQLKNNLIINIINPGIEQEVVFGSNSVVSIGIGIGYSGAYDEITAVTNNGFNYIIAPFVDVQYKFLYNRKKRALKGKTIIYNSGNFVSFRAMFRGKSIFENVERTNNTDFAIGPTWGMQRSYNKLRVLVDVGPQYYFDTLGNNGFFPFMIQVNLGLNLTKSQ